VIDIVGFLRLFAWHDIKSLDKSINCAKLQRKWIVNRTQEIKLHGYPVSCRNRRDRRASIPASEPVQDSSLAIAVIQGRMRVARRSSTTTIPEVQINQWIQQHKS